MTELRCPEIPVDSCVCFVGDVHLGDGGRSDIFRNKDTMLRETLYELAAECDAIVFMGDFFDLPQAMSVRRIIAAHRGVVEAVQELSRKVRVVLIRGNHDWGVDYSRIFPEATQCERLIVGDFLVWHGHVLDSRADVESIGYFAAMSAHAMFERLLGFDFRVPIHDFDTFQNRLMHWAAHRFARALRRAGRGEEFIRYWSREVWGDARAMFDPISSFLSSQSYAGMVCGHTHLPGVVELDGRLYVNAGSWTFRSAEVAMLKDRAIEVRDLLTERAIEGENYEWMVRGIDPGDFFEWWDAHYLGRLRFRPAINPVEIDPLGSEVCNT